MEDMPQNSHFRYEMIGTLAGTEKEGAMNNWGWQNFLVYFLFPDHFSKSEVEAKCNQVMKTIKPRTLTTHLNLQYKNKSRHSSLTPLILKMTFNRKQHYVRPDFFCNCFSGSAHFLL